jgi:L-arabinokinase
MEICLWLVQVDMKGSLEEYHRTCVEHRETLLETESAWLKANQFDLVVSDVVPIACAAAAAAGVPAVCVSNFSWGALPAGHRSCWPCLV